MKKKHERPYEMPISDSVCIQYRFYQNAPYMRCKMWVLDRTTRERYGEHTKSAKTLSDLKEYVNIEGRRKCESFANTLVKDLAFTPGIYLSFFYKFNKNDIPLPAIRTISSEEKEELIAYLFNLLDKHPLSKLSTEYIESCVNKCALWSASRKQKKSATRSDNATANLQNKSFNDCIALLRPIFGYADFLGILAANPIDEIDKKRFRNVNKAITNRLSRSSLSASEEDLLLSEINRAYMLDDGYLALLFALYLPIKPTELCALTYDDIVQNKTFPDMFSFCIQSRSTNDNISKLERTCRHLAKESDYRNVPIPRELRSLLDEKIAQVNKLKEELSRESEKNDANFKLKVKAANCRYIFCKLDTKESFSLSKFFIEKLTNAAAHSEPLVLEDLEKYHFRLMASLLTSHARHRLRTYCGLSESEINYLSGLSQGRDTAGAFYRDWNADITQYGLYLRMNRQSYLVEPYGARSRKHIAQTVILDVSLPANQQQTIHARSDNGLTMTYRIGERKHEKQAKN